MPRPVTMKLHSLGDYTVIGETSKGGIVTRKFTNVFEAMKQYTTFLTNAAECDMVGTIVRLVDNDVAFGATTLIEYTLTEDDCDEDS